MKKFSEKDLGKIVHKIDPSEPDATLITLDHVLKWTVSNLLYVGDEVVYTDEEGQKYSIIVAAI